MDQSYTVSCKGSFYWPDPRKEKRRARTETRGGQKMSCEEEAAFCVLTSCCLIPLSLFQLKEFWTDVLPVVGIGWGGGARKLKLICQLVSKNRIAILIRHAVCVCVCVAVCVSLCRVCLPHSWTVPLLSVSPSFFVPHSQALP